MRINGKPVARHGLLMAAALMMGAAALAEKPDWAGPAGSRGKHSQGEDERGSYQERDRRGDDRRDRDRRDYYPAQNQPRVGVEIRIGAYFGDQQRMGVHDYYQDQYRGGHCPPGLAKKHNGCMPPGQARNWAVGRALPRDAVYYPVEPAVRIRLGTPPAGHEFVRVASDILLIAVGSSMVVDAIQDLGRR